MSNTDHTPPKGNKEPQHLADFDADFSPTHPTNKEAANARGVRYNSGSEFFEDDEGGLVYDKFGQPL